MFVLAKRGEEKAAVLQKKKKLTIQINPLTWFKKNYELIDKPKSVAIYYKQKIALINGR